MVSSIAEQMSPHRRCSFCSKNTFEPGIVFPYRFRKFSIETFTCTNAYPSSARKRLAAWLSAQCTSAILHKRPWERGAREIPEYTRDRTQHTLSYAQYIVCAQYKLLCAQYIIVYKSPYNVRRRRHHYTLPIPKLVRRATIIHLKGLFGKNMYLCPS